MKAAISALKTQAHAASIEQLQQIDSTFEDQEKRKEEEVKVKSEK